MIFWNLSRILKEADKDGSGTVDFFEFVNLMVKRENEKETEEDLKQVFRVFDKVLQTQKLRSREIHQVSL